MTDIGPSLLDTEVNNDLLSRYEAIEDLYRSFLESGARGGDYDYTAHDFRHVKRVQKRICEIIEKHSSGYKTPHLTSYEAYVLAIASLLHDIGMNRNVKFNESGIPDFFYTRDRHEELSLEIIDEKFRDLIDPASEALIEIVKDLIRGHRSQKIIDINSFEEEENYLSETIRIKYLVALLRLSDELENDFRRAPRIAYESRGNIKKEAIPYWKASQTIKSIRCVENGRIEISTQRNPTDEALLFVYYHLVEKMSIELEALVRIFASQQLSTNKIILDGIPVIKIRKMFKKTSYLPKKVSDAILLLLLKEKINPDNLIFEKEFMLEIGPLKWFLIHYDHELMSDSINSKLFSLKPGNGMMLFYNPLIDVSEYTNKTNLKLISCSQPIASIVGRIIS